MLVCHCERVHCREIRKCVHEGAVSAEEVGERCGAGTGCGGCRPLVERLIQRESLVRAQPSAA
ncbi:MAG: (2Fe-2S)-binding protein [Myxococcota bacterium]